VGCRAQPVNGVGAPPERRGSRGQHRAVERTAHGQREDVRIEHVTFRRCGDEPEESGEVVVGLVVVNDAHRNVRPRAAPHGGDDLPRRCKRVESRRGSVVDEEERRSVRGYRHRFGRAGQKRQSQGDRRALMSGTFVVTAAADHRRSWRGRHAKTCLVRHGGLDTGGSEGPDGVHDEPSPRRPAGEGNCSFVRLAQTLVAPSPAGRRRRTARRRRRRTERF
jgi:hypothetical protein